MSTPTQVISQVVILIFCQVLQVWNLLDQLVLELLLVHIAQVLRLGARCNLVEVLGLLLVVVHGLAAVRPT